MKLIITAYVEDNRTINVEKFGDYIREQRNKYTKLLETDKVGLLVVK